MNVLDGRGLNLAEVANKASLPKSSALRLLRTLEQRGFVQRSASERYRVSESILVIAHQVLISSQLKALATPFLVELCAERTSFSVRRETNGGSIHAHGHIFNRRP